MKPEDTNNEKTKSGTTPPQHFKTHVVRNRHNISVRRCPKAIATSVKSTPKRTKHPDKQE